jgi:hypothetical protein
VCFHDHPLLYGRKTWLLGNKKRKHAETSQVRFPRLVLGVTSRDKMSNEDI